MRMMLRVSIPAEKGNAAIEDGSMPKAIRAVMEQIRPEAAYFLPLDGQRTALFFFEMQSQADLVSVVEPFWLSLEADVDLIPALNFPELEAGLSSIHAHRVTGPAGEDLQGTSANPVIE